MPTAAHTQQYHTVNAVEVNADDEVVLNLHRGNRFHWAAATGAVTVVMDGEVAGPYYQEFRFLIEATATAPTVTWPGSFDFVGGTAPTIANNGTHWLQGESWDGGTSWIVRHDGSFAAPV